MPPPGLLKGPKETTINLFLLLSICKPLGPFNWRLCSQTCKEDNVLLPKCTVAKISI